MALTAGLCLWPEFREGTKSCHLIRTRRMPLPVRWPPEHPRRAVTGQTNAASTTGSGTRQVRGLGEPERSYMMLNLVVALLIIALIAAIFGFGGIVAAAVGIAKIIFFVAIVLFLISLVFGGFRGGFGRRL
jgi:uncharacterized membrane protein YtjA (UPF0391 family)